MNGYPKKLFERFSPGFFDLIVFDEAHRSIYDKNNLINEYFDAIKIGLTATPRERETTYDLFECERRFVIAYLRFLIISSLNSRQRLLR
jgi:type I restriction enzyme R subunit